MDQLVARIPAKVRNAIGLLTYLGMSAALAVWGRSVALDAAAQLPAGSPTREALTSFATFALWAPPIALPIALYVSLTVQLTVVKGLRHAAKVATAAAKGDMTQRMEVMGKDELALLASSFNIMTSQVGTAMRGMRETADRLSHAAHELETTSSTMSSSVHETAEQLRTVDDSAQRSTHDLAGIATSTEQMQGAISEISTNTSAVSVAAAGAVTNAEDAKANVDRLRQSSQRIGEVVKGITAIASQTNLLALNATIEAVRAGESGRGFAIVANEVKELASATAAATDEITDRIQEIQTDTERAVEAVARIAGVIEEISSYQHTIASAVEEQTAVTHTMAVGAGAASESSLEIASALTSVRDAAELANDATAQTSAAAAELAEMSTELTRLAASFRY
ncbi:methyl-accepting chemotaxis protein [Actinoplanes sp. NPDC049681]|uniref:methyl-accepting chemotaxis protein n=1 Tax=Actinoplanes sp. NPDC049681 TaxID=3363905 RepID=UPI00379965EC